MLQLVEPEGVSFEEICTIQPLPELSSALRIPSAPINLLVLQFLNKATASPTSVAQIASTPDLVQAWVYLWLSTPETNVAHKAAEVLKTSLLRAGPGGSLDPESNLMARRLFKDEDVYGAMFSLCDPKSQDGIYNLGRRQKTTAQGRLLAFVIDIDGPDSPVRTSQCVSVELHHGLKDGGLLWYTLSMMEIDGDDELMLSVYIESCARYLSKRSEPGADISDWPLECLKASGAHRRCIEFYLYTNKGYSSWLVSASAGYLAAYCANWPENFISDKVLLRQVLRLLGDALQTAPRSAWNSPSARLNSHLSVLSRLPRHASLPDVARYTGEEPPLYLLPDNTPNENIVKSLAHAFCEAEGEKEASAARVVYFLYLQRHPNFWSQMVKLADNLSMTETVLASIRLIDAFISASWSPLPAEKDLDATIQLPLESDLIAKGFPEFKGPLPSSGLEALLTETAGTVIIPYLLEPPRSSNYRDENSSAWKVASAKFDLITHLYRALERNSDLNEAFRPIMSELRHRISMGPISGAIGIGGEVGTENR